MNRHDLAVDLMRAFVERTGLVGPEEPTRYLWTDAFAVCNLLEIDRIGAFSGIELAEALIDQVHDILGARAERRSETKRLGGIDEATFLQTPTRGGLRIGKPLPERARDEPFDERLEWRRDGQYFHYLTRWMHALGRAAEVTGCTEYHRWAVALSEVAFSAFVVRGSDGRARRMVWKMSVDLDRPLVASMGQHDALDGWITARELAAAPLAAAADRSALARQAAVYRELALRCSWSTDDLLGAGGLLTDAWRLWRADGDSAVDRVTRLIADAARGLDRVIREPPVNASPSERLAFRELGLVIGVRAAARLGPVPSADRQREAVVRWSVRRALRSLTPVQTLADSLERTWLHAGNRRLPVWLANRDINEVMLATSLAPDGYLGAAAAVQSESRDDGFMS